MLLKNDLLLLITFLSLFNFAFATSNLPYEVNSSFGIQIPNNSITIDGQNSGEWDNSMLIARDGVNDDPRSLGENWTMHETSFDLTHLWASWDDAFLYLAWQYVDVTDIIDPVNAGSSAGTKISQMDLIQWIAIDTIPNEGSRLDMWNKNYGEPYWTGTDVPDIQIYLASNLWQGYISRAVNGKFQVDDGGVNYHSIRSAGIEVEVANTLAAPSLWGAKDVDNIIDSESIIDFLLEGHDSTRDSFYEMKIPLSALGIDKNYIKENGIKVMLGQGEGSAVDTIPHDPATMDEAGTTPSNSTKEWEDIDSFTENFAQIGGNAK